MTAWLCKQYKPSFPALEFSKPIICVSAAGLSPVVSALSELEGGHVGNGERCSLVRIL